MAMELCPKSLAGGTVRKWNMVVSNVVEEVDLFLLQHQARGDGVNRRIAPSFVEETAILVQGLEEVDVRLRAQPVQVADLKVGPL